MFVRIVLWYNGSGDRKLFSINIWPGFCIFVSLRKAFIWGQNIKKTYYDEEMRIECWRMLRRWTLSNKLVSPGRRRLVQWKRCGVDHQGFGRSISRAQCSILGHRTYWLTHKTGRAWKERWALRLCPLQTQRSSLISSLPLKVNYPSLSSQRVDEILSFA